MDEPQRHGNASEAALHPTERRDLILAVLTIQREFHDMTGNWLKVQDIEDRLTGKVLF